MTQLYVIPIEDVSVGDVLIADGGFTCLEEGEKCKVYEREGRLGIACTGGFHFLDGQEDNFLIGHGDATHYVGFLKAG